MLTNRKSTRILTLALTLGAVLLGVIGLALKWSTSTFVYSLFLYVLLAMLIGFTVEFFSLRKIQRQLQALKVNYKETGQLERYIEGVEALLRDARSQDLLNVKHMNIGAAYTDLGNAKEAIHHFAQVNPKKFGRVNRWAYHANLALAYFRQGDAGSAREHLSQLKDARGRLQASPLQTLITILDIYDLAARGELEEGRRKFEALSPATNETEAAYYEELEARLKGEPPHEYS